MIHCTISAMTVKMRGADLRYCVHIDLALPLHAEQDSVLLDISVCLPYIHLRHQLEYSCRYITDT